MAMAPGDRREVAPGLFPAPSTGEWQRWEIGDGGVGAQGLRSSAIFTRYERQDVHRADMIRGTHGLLDINGDGLVDWIEAVEPYQENGQSRAGFDAYDC